MHSVDPLHAALRRNDRYLKEFVEALGICPFARRCRETGKLFRRVLASPAEAPGALAELDAVPAGSVEVALLVFPTAAAGDEAAARAWERFVAGLRPQLSARWHAVAFHPDLPIDATTPARAVSLLRRSPDPTLQLVDAAALRNVQQGREGGSRYAPAGTTAEALAHLAQPGLSDEIAAANHAAVLSLGVERVAALLRSFRA